MTYFLFVFLNLWFVLLQLAKTLTACDILLGIVAAATHDLDHPGVNQSFLIKTDHYLAALYNVRPQHRLTTTSSGHFSHKVSNAKIIFDPEY